MCVCVCVSKSESECLYNSSKRERPRLCGKIHVHYKAINHMHCIPQAEHNPLNKELTNTAYSA